MKGYMYYRKGWGAGAGRSRVFLAPWSRLRKKQEPEPLQKKTRSQSRQNFAAPAPYGKIKKKIEHIIFF